MDEGELGRGDLDSYVGVGYGEFTEGSAEVLCFLDGFELGSGNVAAEVGS